MTTVVTLLGSSSGAVAGPTVVSNKVKGIAYYHGKNDISTVAYSLLTGFNGLLVLQGTLKEDPAATDWVDIAATEHDCTGTPTAQNETISKNFKGNFVWVRAEATSYTAGAINTATLSYL